MPNDYTPAAETAHIEVTDWWITDQFFSNGGRKVMGPFVSRDLALEVRLLREHLEQRSDYFVDSEVRRVQH